MIWKVRAENISERFEELEILPRQQSMKWRLPIHRRHTFSVLFLNAEVGQDQGLARQKQRFLREVDSGCQAVISVAAPWTMSEDRT